MNMVEQLYFCASLVYFGTKLFSQSNLKMDSMNQTNDANLNPYHDCAQQRSVLNIPIDESTIFDIQVANQMFDVTSNVF